MSVHQGVEEFPEFRDSPGSGTKRGDVRASSQRFLRAVEQHSGLHACMNCVQIVKTAEGFGENDNSPDEPGQPNSAIADGQILCLGDVMGTSANPSDGSSGFPQIIKQKMCQIVNRLAESVVERQDPRSVPGLQFAGIRQILGKGVYFFRGRRL